MIDISTGSINYERHAAGSHIDGRWVEGGITVLSIADPSIQPLRASEIKMLPEGRRNAETIKIYTETKLLVADEKNKVNADVVLYDGKRYEVHMVSNWSIGTDIKHYKVIAIKEDGEGNG